MKFSAVVTWAVGFVRDTIRLALQWRAWKAGLRAARLPSLVIAGFSCAVGAVMAWRDGHGDVLNTVVMSAAGLALQGGVNMVNDFFEFRQKKVQDKVAAYGFSHQEREFLELLIFLVGLALFGFSGLAGLFLAWRSGWPVLLFGLVGWASGFFYTGEPFNYKRRGLAVALVFFFMGVIMIPGAYYAVAARFSWDTVVLSIPVSFLISLILLANELRDFESDRRFGIRTLTVRMGYGRSIALYCALLACAYASPAILYGVGYFARFPIVYLAVAAAAPPFLLMGRPPQRRGAIIPLVMLHHLVYGFAYCVSLLRK